ncbi:MAG: FecR family protein [Flammeovirgaceae bacterium]
MQPNENENIYAKWLNGELSETELEALQAANELPVLEKIVSEVDTWQLPKAKSSYHDFKSKLSQKEQGAKRRRLYRLTLSIAASIVLLLVAFAVIYTQYFNITEYQTLAGQRQSFSLPDGSNVTLNGNSQLSFQNFNWTSDRKVNFQGQAFFEVKKGGTFQVVLPDASVQVLGTKFDVLAQPEALNVQCFAGEVVVAYQNKQERLSKGQGFRAAAQTGAERFDFQAEAEQPSWIGSTHTQFKNAPLQEVLDALSMKYGFEFKNVLGSHQELRFTGQFINTNGEQALKMVLDTFGISYSKEGNTIRLE